MEIASCDISLLVVSLVNAQKTFLVHENSPKLIYNNVEFENCPGVTPSDPHCGRGRPPSHTHTYTQHGLRQCLVATRLALRTPQNCVPPIFQTD